MARDRPDSLRLPCAGPTAAWRRPAAAGLLALALGAACAAAQPLTAPRFNTNFSNPGARSLGFGGAFAALADDFLPERLAISDRLAIDDPGWTANAGVLWSLTELVSAGLFYRQGAEARAASRSEVRLIPTNPPIPIPPTVAEGTAQLRVPDLWGAGLAVRSKGGRVTVAGEVDRVGCAGLLEVRDGDGDLVEGRLYRDACEFHLGAECALLRRRPILAFRLGAWVEANGDDVIEDRFTHLSGGEAVASRRPQDVPLGGSEQVGIDRLVGLVRGTDDAEPLLGVEGLEGRNARTSGRPRGCRPWRGRRGRRRRRPAGAAGAARPCRPCRPSRIAVSLSCGRLPPLTAG
jgi:hypothetical protein